MFENALEIFFAHRVEDALAASLLEPPHRDLSSVLDRRLESALTREIGERLSRERRVEAAARELHVLRIAAAALVADHRDRVFLDPRARRRVVEAFELVLSRAFER